MENAWIRKHRQNPSTCKQFIPKKKKKEKKLSMWICFFLFWVRLFIWLFGLRLERVNVYYEPGLKLLHKRNGQAGIFGPAQKLSANRLLQPILEHSKTLLSLWKLSGHRRHHQRRWWFLIFLSLRPKCWKGEATDTNDGGFRIHTVTLLQTRHSRTRIHFSLPIRKFQTLRVSHSLSFI